MNEFNEYINTIDIDTEVHIWDVFPDAYSSASYMMSLWRSACDTLPYLYTLTNLFIAILVFELSLYIMKLFLGSRSPVR